MLKTALDHYRSQQRLTAAALLRIRQARTAGDIAEIVAAFQILVARDAIDASALMLEEQGIESDPAGTVVASSVAGTASDGRPLESLFSQAETDQQFDLMVVTQLQDAARVAASLAMVSNFGATGYVRMLNPPSCSRCAVQAGKWFRWNQGFQRHPRCDCRHVPSRENISGDLRTNPDAYFQSLSTEEQNRIFTNAGATAIRDGADLTQVVNARRGMSTAQVNLRGWTPSGRLAPVKIGGRPAFVSSEGTTKRGLAFRERTGRKMSQRVMPETIYDIAKDRADAIRLLKLNGFVL